MAELRLFDPDTPRRQRSYGPGPGVRVAIKGFKRKGRVCIPASHPDHYSLVYLETKDGSYDAGHFHWRKLTPVSEQE